jgi:hypothetical protein
MTHNQERKQRLNALDSYADNILAAERKRGADEREFTAAHQHTQDAQAHETGEENENS